MPSKHPRAARFIREGFFEQVSSFPELEARISALGDERSLDVGDTFEIFVEAYLATQPLMQADTVWLVGQVPLEVRQALNLPSDAKGIDGILRDRTGQYVPYQVKFRSARARLSFTEVAPFLGVTDRATDRLLITNANALAGDAAKRDGLRTLRGTDFDGLTSADFTAIADWLKARPVGQDRIVPRDDQRLAVAKLTAALETSDRATVVMACGTGKTLVQLWAAEALGAQRVLVLVPSLSLIQQTLTEWSRQTAWGERFRYLCVCSDPTVTDGVDTLDPLLTTQADLDFRVDTDASVVSAFLTGADDAVRVVFSTYQSATVVAEGCPGGPAFDLGIFDEAHKTTGPRDGLFAYALTDANLPIRKRAFFTATPRHYLQTRDKEGDFKTVSMDDESIYGPIAHELSFAAAVAAGIICDYRVVLSVVDAAEVTAFALQHGITLVKGDQQATAWVASQVALAHAIAETQAMKVITFHSRVKHAELFASDTERGIGQYLDTFTVSHVNGSQSTADRRDTLAGFRDGRNRLVTNARCLTEGVDLPAVDMVAFINPRKSKVDIVQATGRAMRKPRDREKRFGYIVVPVLLDREDRDSIEEACQQTDWADVIDVLAALRDSDARLVDVVADVLEARGRGELFNPRPLREHVQVLGPRIDLDVLQRSIDNVILDRLGVSWDEMYGRLQGYKIHEADVNVPSEYPDDLKLGAWCNTQRTVKRLGVLSTERIVKLGALGFVWEPQDTAWVEMYGRLQAFKIHEGHVNVPAEYPADAQLGTWCDKQRAKKRRLSVERIARLEALGFVWEPRDAAWGGMYARLQAFKTSEGHVDVPRAYRDDLPLAAWCNTQRALRRRSLLSAERVAKLEALGFVWEPHDTAWHEMYGRLQAFRLHEGHVNVPNEYPADPPLGRWCVGLRARKRTLSVERIAKLEALGFVWKPSDAAWDEMFGRLQAFKAKNHSCDVPEDFSDDPQLGRWCNTQRAFKRRGRLSAGRIARLNDLGFVWVPYDAGWEEMYGRLRKYKEQSRHCNVPRSYPNDPSLGMWCHNQRRARKKTTPSLTAERISRLDELGFAWEPFDAAWDEMYARLSAFRQEHGHCNMAHIYPADPGLGLWCSGQRQTKKRNTLAAERIAKLDALGFVWEPSKARDPKK